MVRSRGDHWDRCPLLVRVPGSDGVLGFPPNARSIFFGQEISMDSTGTSGSAVSDVEAMMKELGLREEDLDDNVFDEKEAPKEAVRWVALVRVNTKKTYKQDLVLS